MTKSVKQLEREYADACATYADVATLAYVRHKEMIQARQRLEDAKHVAFAKKLGISPTCFQPWTADPHIIRTRL